MSASSGLAAPFRLHDCNVESYKRKPLFLRLCPEPLTSDESGANDVTVRDLHVRDRQYMGRLWTVPNDPSKSPCATI
ncbi:unnamed protein product [Ranitomeya imitator]|uniref:Uncharacterized protein n=1 Tax=Ranitomeya imitator TaxID=111125 RepID=A0ABN9MNS8_9NEOB|nr:unnamed protein product [Ranitomeya imitator]